MVRIGGKWPGALPSSLRLRIGLCVKWTWGSLEVLLCLGNGVEGDQCTSLQPHRKRGLLGLWRAVLVPCELPRAFWNGRRASGLQLLGQQKKADAISLAVLIGFSSLLSGSLVEAF